MTDHQTVTVRYRVTEIDRSIAFYTEQLGFEPGECAGSAFASGTSRQSATHPRWSGQLRVSAAARRTPAHSRWLQPHFDLRGGACSHHRTPP